MCALIDLTNTDRYYDKVDVEHRNCKHIKIACRGRGAVPDATEIDRFLILCDSFLAKFPQRVSDKY